MEPLDIRRRDYVRPRDARVALIRCGDCNEYYETSVRQARRIRKGESRRLCPMCRTLEEARDCTPDQTQAYVLWWLEESGIPHAELQAIATSVAMTFPEEARPGEPVMSPSRRLAGEEGNRPSGDGSVARIHISGNSQLISTNAA
jgi:hypothetical protein